MCGLDVTMFQRSSTYIMSIANGWKYLMDGKTTGTSMKETPDLVEIVALYSEDAPPVDVADRLNASFPNSLVVDISRRQVQQIAAADK